MFKKCRICQTDFEITNKFAHSRQFCYDCVPENLDRMERTNAKRRAIKKQALNLLGGSCLKCGITESYLIDFHHVDSDLKEQSFGKLLGDSKIEEYFKELEKAVPLCANCHRTFHHLEKKNKITLEEFVNLKDFFHYEDTFNRSYQKIAKPVKRVNTFTAEEAELLLEKVKISSFTEVGKQLGVSGSAVQKKLREHGYPHLINEIKSKDIKTKETSWKELPITLEKDSQTYSFNKGEDASVFIQEIYPDKDLLRIREGLSRIIRRKRESYLGFKILWKAD